MKHEPLVSIMMPVYNGYPLIRASVESLKKQNYSNWECIIIDDGSTDDTPVYLDSIEDSRFIVHHLNNNSGRAVARQKALELCKGNYIGMLDAEDLIHPDKIKTQVQFLEQHEDFSLVTSALCSFGTKTDILLVRGATNTGENIFNRINHPVHAPSLYRAEFAKKCSYNSVLRLGEDQDFLEKYLSFNPKFFILNEVLYYYSELDSVTKQKIKKNYYLYVKKYFKEKNYKQTLIFALKYIYSLIFFPFMSIDSLLYKRGRKANIKETNEFLKYCKPIIDGVIKKTYK